MTQKQKEKRGNRQFEHRKNPQKTMFNRLRNIGEEIAFIKQEWNVICIKYKQRAQKTSWKLEI